MLRFLISNKRERQHFEHLAGPIEFGRGPERDGLPRCVIQDGYVSKDHVRVEELPGSQLRIENLSARNPIWQRSGTSRLMARPTRSHSGPVPAGKTWRHSTDGSSLPRMWSGRSSGS